MPSRVIPAPRAAHRWFARRCCSTWNTDIAADWCKVGRTAVRRCKFNRNPHRQIGRVETRALGAACVNSVSRETTCATAIWQMCSFPASRCRLTQAAALTDFLANPIWMVNPAGLRSRQRIACRIRSRNSALEALCRVRWQSSCSSHPNSGAPISHHDSLPGIDHPVAADHQHLQFLLLFVLNEKNLAIGRKCDALGPDTSLNL